MERRRQPREGRWVEHVKTVALRVVWKSDATTIRLILAVASLLWALSIWFTPWRPNGGPYLALDSAWNGAFSPTLWGALFFLHFLGVFWRVFDPVRRTFWGLVINSYGLGLWLTVTLSLSYHLGTLHLGVATDWALCLFAAWALLKTGASDDLVSP